MEDNKKTAQNKVQAKDKKPGPKWQDGVYNLPTSKDSWRRVFNEGLGCFEIYVKGGNVLVATGIGNEADSFAIGMIPATIDLLEQILIEIKNGEVTEATYRGLRYIINEHSRVHGKAKRMGKADI